MRNARALPLLAAIVVAAPLGAQTRMLRSPSVSARHVAFTYASNVWVVDRQLCGANADAKSCVARRLTSFAGETSNPRLSPDGALVAFSADYGGNVDVYVVPVEGGEPRRLTWHPSADAVQGWTPDGKAVLFASGRATASPSPSPRFWQVPVAGGMETALALPRAYQGKLSPDGKRVAFRLNNSWDEERRNYRGGQNRPVWITDLASHETVTPPWTGSKDMDPVWVGDAVWFISDRDGVANVWAFDTRAKQLRQVTSFRDFDVKTLGADASATASAGTVVFEQGGQVHELDVATGKERALPITAAGDFPWMMPRCRSRW
jgi:tricorn protease